MATVIRDAVIRIGLQQIPTELKAPDVTPFTAGQDKIDASAKRAAESLKAVGATADDLALKSLRHAEEANLRALNSFQQLGTSVLQAGRGFAFFAAGSSDSLNEFLPLIAQVQGGIDVFRGGTLAMLRFNQALIELDKSTQKVNAGQAILKGVIGSGSLGLAVAGLTTAIGLGTVAWAAWGDAAETALQKAARAAERERNAQELTVSHLRERLSLVRQLERESAGGTARERLGALSNVDPGSLQAQLRLAEQREAEARAEELRIRGMTLGAFATTEATGTRDVPGQQAAAIRQARELQVGAVQQQLDLTTALGERERAINDEKINALRATQQATDEQLRTQEQLITKRQRELEVASKALGIEQEKARSIEAQLGTLNRGEQAELRRLAQRHAAGEQLSAQQLQRLGQLGGGLTRDITNTGLENIGRPIAEEIAKVLGINRQAGVASAEQRQRQAEIQLDQATGGKPAAEALAEIARDRATALQELKSSVDELRQVNNEHVKMTRELGQEVFQLKRDIEGANF